MKFLMNIAEAVAGDVSVNFRRGDGGMTEEFLNDAEVGAVFEQVSRKTVAQHVRCDIPSNPGTTNALFDAEPECDRRERRAALCEKDVGWRARSYEFGPSDRDVAFESGHGLLARGQDTFFVAFADDVNETSFEVELFEPKAAQFGEAQAGSIGEFEDCLIAKRLGSFRCFGREELIDFLAGKRFGQTFPSARK